MNRSLLLGWLPADNENLGHATKNDLKFSIRDDESLSIVLKNIQDPRQTQLATVTITSQVRTRGTAGPRLLGQTDI